MLYPNHCYNEKCYKGTALYLLSDHSVLKLSGFYHVTSTEISPCMSYQTVYMVGP